MIIWREVIGFALLAPLLWMVFLIGIGIVLHNREEDDVADTMKISILLATIIMMALVGIGIINGVFVK